MKKRNLILLSALLISSFTMISCRGNNSSSSNVSSSENLNNPLYTIKVTSLSGKPLSQVKVGIYTGDNLVKECVTDENGNIETRLEDSNYSVKLSNIPNGYYVEKDFELVKGTQDYKFRLHSNVINETAPSGTFYQLGDLVYDFTVTTSDGEKFTLSEAVKDYDAVLINFWYVTCGWCVKEFPYMEEAYQDYKNDIGVIALSHMDRNAAIEDFKYDNELSFPMANDTTQYGLFGVQGCPTSVIIDRYGIIAYIEEGAITSKEGFTEVFDKFIGEDYVPSVNYGGLGGEENPDDVDRTPTYEMPESSAIEAIVNGEGFNATYREDEDEENKQYAWPWIISEDGKSIKASNSKVDYTAATIMFDVTIPNGQTLAFDYLSSSELDYDILYVIVDGVIIQQISGVENNWKTCYAFVSNETKSYEIALCYMKDEDGFAGDDTVYVNNIRIVNNEDIYTYDVKVSYAKKDNYKVELVNTINNHEQIILRNGDGVYVVTPRINKSFKFQSDWPYNNSQVYLLSSLIDELDAINRLNNSELYKCEKELKELEISISKNEVKLDNYLNTLNEEYELTYEKARDNYSLEVSVEEARSLVSTYKNNIKRLGMVNLAAIDEYKRVSERYEFLTSQRNDLVNAKETLLEIIDEMDEVMKEEFTKTFKLVDEEFKKVFKELFKGGNAHLKLTDPNNVLETDIEINACPPGKKLKTLSLLSGGEKTLTAISLIFAILNVRTVPFCLFDEVEAALDEANVDSFGKYLNLMKEKTQFIVITHKKKTMEFVDILYGITMQESGVSKLVSVKLEDHEDLV